MGERIRLAFAALIFTFFISTIEGREIQRNTNNVNVFSLENLFDSIDHNASVYLCDVSKREPSLESNSNIERGIVTLNIKKIFFGQNRQSIVLPYAFVPVGGISTDGFFIWPALDNIGKSNILCVVVPNAKDPMMTIKGITEAASKVILVSGEKDPNVQEMETISKLFDTKGTPEFIQALNKAIADPRPTVRDFALQAAVMKLGRTTPDETFKILQSTAAQYKEGQDASEVDRLFYYVRGKFGHVEPWDQMNKLLCCCLVAFTQSPSKAVRENAINTLANAISFFSYRPDFRLQDGLNASEKSFLKEALDSELKSGSDNTNVRSLKEWMNH